VVAPELPGPFRVERVRGVSAPVDLVCKLQREAYNIIGLRKRPVGRTRVRLLRTLVRRGLIRRAHVVPRGLPREQMLHERGLGLLEVTGDHSRSGLLQPRVVQVERFEELGVGHAGPQAARLPRQSHVIDDDHRARVRGVPPARGGE